MCGFRFVAAVRTLEKKQFRSDAQWFNRFSLHLEGFVERIPKMFLIARMSKF